MAPPKLRSDAQRPILVAACLLGARGPGPFAASPSALGLAQQGPTLAICFRDLRGSLEAWLQRSSAEFGSGFASVSLCEDCERCQSRELRAILEQLEIPVEAISAPRRSEEREERTEPLSGFEV